MIGCEDRLRNDLYCVEWGVKLYSNQPTNVCFLIWIDKNAAKSWARRRAGSSRNPRSSCVPAHVLTSRGLSVCLCPSVSVLETTDVNPAKKVEPIEMPFGGADSLGWECTSATPGEYGGPGGCDARCSDHYCSKLFHVSDVYEITPLGRSPVGASDVTRLRPPPHNASLYHAAHVPGSFDFCPPGVATAHFRK